MLSTIATILSAIGFILNFMKQAFDSFNSGLDTTKKALEIFNNGTENLDKADKNIQPLEHSRAASELLRSLAIFGFLEYLLWATKAVIIIATMQAWVRFVTKRMEHVR